MTYYDVHPNEQNKSHQHILFVRRSHLLNLQYGQPQPDAHLFELVNVRNAIASCHPGRMFVPIRASSYFYEPPDQSLPVLGISDIHLIILQVRERERKRA